MVIFEYELCRCILVYVSVTGYATRAPCTYQAVPQCVQSVACEFSDDMVIITITLVVNVLNDAKSDLREVQLADHRIAHCDLSATYSEWDLQTYLR